MIVNRAVGALCWCFLALPTSAFATPIKWEFQGIVFGDGGAAFGSFVYDAETNAFTDINVVTTVGIARGGSIYTTTNPFVTYNTAYGFFLAGDLFLPGSPGMIIGTGGMTNAGGSFLSPWFVLSEGPYNQSLTGLVVDSTYRQAASGGIVSAGSVPEPSSLLLTALGLASFLCAGSLIRHRTNRAS